MCNSEIPNELLPDVAISRLQYEKLPMSTLESQDKVAIFFTHYNDEAKVIEHMSDEELENRIAEISSLAFELNARGQRAEKEKTDRLKRKFKSENGSDEEYDVNAAIEVVKERKKRITKSEKMMGGLTDLLGSREDAMRVLGNIDKTKFNPDAKSTTQRIEGIRGNRVVSAMCDIERHTDCVGSWRDNEGSKVCKCKCHDKEFDPDELFK